MEIIISAISFVIVLTIHEFAHAYFADRLGDPTPRAMGRLTLNPLAHLDTLGTLAIIFIGFGWAKPVPFDPYNLRHPRRDIMLISLAGPLANLALALVLSFLIPLLGLGIFASILRYLLMSNIMIAIFNLVPVFPLDGEKVLAGLLPPHLAQEFVTIMRQYGTIILVLLILPIAGGISPISALISPIISFVSNLLL